LRIAAGTPPFAYCPGATGVAKAFFRCDIMHNNPPIRRPPPGQSASKPPAPAAVTASPGKTQQQQGVGSSTPIQLYFHAREGRYGTAQWPVLVRGGNSAGGA
jgi:hypothetical protein